MERIEIIVYKKLHLGDEVECWDEVRIEYPSNKIPAQLQYSFCKKTYHIYSCDIYHLDILLFTSFPTPHLSPYSLINVGIYELVVHPHLSFFK